MTIVYVARSHEWEDFETVGVFTELRAAIRAARIFGSLRRCSVEAFILNGGLVETHDEVWSGYTLVDRWHVERAKVVLVKTMLRLTEKGA